ncbi:MAG: formate dehydrogenase accessory protein FdhE [Desulfobulbaceae bacterium]|jgi:FdhE protein|nr:formate dehydrogenase accessory protein FdhE [Desulfobulbaceae bacterium]
MEAAGGLASPGRQTSSIIQMELPTLYAWRGQRLRALAAGKKAMAAYLLFAAGLVDWQRAWLEKEPLPPPDSPAPLAVDWQNRPLAPTSGMETGYWRAALDDLLASCADKLAANRAANLTKKIAAIDEAAVLALLAGDITLTGTDGAPFLWAALSLYWAQWARARPLAVRELVGAARDLCPLCGAAPVAAVVAAHPHDGLRYLRCSLCESDWRLVRAQCSACGQSGKLRYWSVDEEKGIHSESCGDCMSHLKILEQNNNPGLEPLADDLASLSLDAFMEEQGFARSGLNPFLFSEH